MPDGCCVQHAPAIFEDCDGGSTRCTCSDRDTDIDCPDHGLPDPDAKGSTATPSRQGTPAGHGDTEGLCDSNGPAGKGSQP